MKKTTAGMRSFGQPRKTYSAPFQSTPGGQQLHSHHSRLIRRPYIKGDRQQQANQTNVLEGYASSPKPVWRTVKLYDFSSQIGPLVETKVANPSRERGKRESSTFFLEWSNLCALCDLRDLRVKAFGCGLAAVYCCVT